MWAASIKKWSRVYESFLQNGHSDALLASYRELLQRRDTAGPTCQAFRTQLSFTLMNQGGKFLKKQ